ncbi:MAG TPA: divalent-cation tolerance protein CutA [Patescibacteria group bacterium]|nr:divalent-cation tolerance protein CutA [Patescibacteria group bacterium]
MSEFCELVLTCGNQIEANKISKALLGKRLVACVRQFPVSSAYWWKGKIEKDSEILLLMEGKEHLFDKIEAIVLKLHSYETPGLYMKKMLRVSDKAAKWLEAETNG